MDVDECRLVGVTDDLATVGEVRTLADYVEFRLGSAANPRAQLSSYADDIPLVLSPRAATEGGETLAFDEVASMVSVAPPDIVAMVEVPLEDADDEGEVLPGIRERGVQVLISSYTNEKTPSKRDLREIISRCRERGDLVKIVVSVKDEGDALVLLECLNDASREGTKIAGYGTGAAGKHTRVISAFYGSTLAYAPIRPDDRSDDIGLKQLADVLETITNTEGIEHRDGLSGNR
ncbi:type I 3-dehydroquinate dehydratase [Halogeometricum sp. S1BR25-6]|uniref:3-dehydroquinate dehydratase n=1 Tax=Halogeometricum salsisoli TaxID=2950536 RepID=A0ABU2GAV6_9EURY|nr:type I 3-dehydroquinate dehydratase [Halogeometricum sp. S1BR25-6]MDS0297920.1 type I 3-dehydroquinate dehydratase [Halogeometricum sp. S1BR25-6]